MNERDWSHSESSRLVIAALCAVAMHVSLACLPVQWRPILPTPNVLRVTLTPPTPTPAPPIPQPPITPAATVAAVPEPPIEAAPPPRPEPSVQPVAIARPPAPPKVVQPPPKPKRPPEPRKPPTATQPAPTLAKPKSAKPIERPPVIVAKTTTKEPKESAPRPERIRPTVAKAASPQGMGSESGNDSGRTTRSYRKALEDDFDAAPSAGRFADRISKPVESHSGNSAEAAPAPPARVAAVATSLRPLPGNPRPRYPEQLRQRGIEGQVLVRLTVSAAGSVESASVARSSGHDLLDQEARATVLRWRFQPLEGPKVAQLPITFRLQN